MTAPAISPNSDELGVAEFVAHVMRAVRDQELSVPNAVALIWEREHGSLNEAAVGELARSGVEARVHRALSDERFMTPTVIQPRRPGDREFRMQPRVASAPIQSRSVKFRMLDVLYTGRDGRVYPIRKFIMTDVEAVIERLSRSIEGQTRVKDWFGTVRDALQASGTDRVADLPEAVLSELNSASPFAAD